MCQRGTFTHARPSFYHSPPLRVPPSAALSVAASATRPLSVPPPPPAAVAVAAVSAAATIAFSADIAAAFWLIIVCPRCRCHRCCLQVPLPMLPPSPPPPLFRPPSSLPPLPIFLPLSTLPLCFNVSDCLCVSTFPPPRTPLPLFRSPSPS